MDSPGLFEMRQGPCADLAVFQPSSRDNPSVRSCWYLRTLLVHGARSEMMRTAQRIDPKSRWAEALKSKKGWNKAAVALANKHARIVWSMLAHQQS